MILRAINPANRVRLGCMVVLLTAWPAPGDTPKKIITHYNRYFAFCTSAYTLTALIALRSGEIDGVEHLLLVDPATLLTTMRPAHEFHVHEASLEEIRSRCGGSAYGAALADAERRADTLADAGITHTSVRSRGIDVTVDLCPSRRGLDRTFFIDLVKTLGTSETPIPVAIAVTGVWMKEHPDDMQWLLQNVKENKLSITWVNHSFRHRFKRGEDFRSNFLLEKGTDLDQEILLTEKALLETEAMPSVFFRFPGLISNKAVFTAVLSYGLIPVGSDAWLAKNERPTDGSIVLVHANGNEPVGIQRFLKLIREEKHAADRRQWTLFDLRESVVETEENKGMQ